MSPKQTHIHYWRNSVLQEIAELIITPGQEAAFEEGARKAVPLFLRAKGCLWVSFHRYVETPNQYTLVVDWATVENHMVDFRESEDFQEWRRLVGHTFASPPNMHHHRKVIG
jgi:quinol monooxygenase YgiN